MRCSGSLSLLETAAEFGLGLHRTSYLWGLKGHHQGSISQMPDQFGGGAVEAKRGVTIVPVRRGCRVGRPCAMKVVGPSGFVLTVNDRRSSCFSLRPRPQHVILSGMLRAPMHFGHSRIMSKCCCDHLATISAEPSIDSMACVCGGAVTRPRLLC